MTHNTIGRPTFYLSLLSCAVDVSHCGFPKKSRLEKKTTNIMDVVIFMQGTYFEGSLSKKKKNMFEKGWCRPFNFCAFSSWLRNNLNFFLWRTHSNSKRVKGNCFNNFYSFNKLYWIIYLIYWLTMVRTSPTYTHSWTLPNSSSFTANKKRGHILSCDN